MKKILATITGITLLLSPVAAFADYTIVPAIGTTGLVGVAAPTPIQVGQSFTTIGAGTIGKVDSLMDDEATTPADNLLLDIYATDGSGFATGASLGQAVISNDVGTPCNSKTFTYGSPVSVNAATKYALVWSRSGVASGVNYSVVCGTNAVGGYGGGQLQRKDVAIWSNLSQQASATVFVTEAAIAVPQAGTLILFGDW